MGTKMMNRLADFDRTYSTYLRRSFLPKKGKPGSYGKDVHYMSINPDVLELLHNTKVPKKLLYLKLPFDWIYVPTRLEFGIFSMPQGFSITVIRDMQESTDEEADDEIEHYVDEHNEGKKVFEPWLGIQYVISFYYETPKSAGFLVMRTSSLWQPKGSAFDEIMNYPEKVRGMDPDEYEEWEQSAWELAGTSGARKKYSFVPYNEISQFVYKLLLFLDCPDVQIIRTEGRAKKFRNQSYDFFEPKKLFVSLSHDLIKYIQEVKHKHGVRYTYHYRYIVRGHFRTMQHSRYKREKTIWVKPFFKGNGKYIPKEKIVCRTL